VTYPRTGFALYTQHASPAFHAGLSLAANPPQFPALPQLSSPSATFDRITGYSISYTILGSLSPVYLLTYGSRPVSIPIRDYRSLSKYPPPYIFRNWRFLRCNSHALGTSSETLTTYFQIALGTCQAQEVVAVRAFLWHPDALASPPTLISTLVSP